MDETDSYKVGYKKPPKETRFKKGQTSPNPNGRPKGNPTFSDLLSQGLQERIIITENGHRRELTVKEAIAKRMLLNAVKGNDKAFERIQRLAPEKIEEESKQSFMELLNMMEFENLSEGELDTFLNLLRKAGGETPH